MARNPRDRRNRKNSTFESILKTSTSKVICTLLIFFLIFLISFCATRLYIVSASQKAIVYDLEKVQSLSNSSNDVGDNDFEPSRSFTLCSIGDVMCHNTQYMDAYNSSTGVYDFSYVFDDIIKYTQSPDITIGSLETSFAGADVGYSNYPRFNSPDSLASGLHDIGVDVVSTAGNHCLDMGFSGLSRTIDVLDNSGLAHLGTYKSQDDSEKILYKSVNDVKIAFVNYTYGTNGIPLPSDKPFCVNLIDKDFMKSQLDKAKSEGAQMIVACMHWGVEYQTVASTEQEELADFLFKNGVDVILGNHPHTLEPMEKRKVTLDDGSTKDCFVIYALGNFICDQNAENTRNSIILNLKIMCDSKNNISIDDVSYIPIHMYKDLSKSSHRFKVLDIKKSISSYEDGSDTSIGSATYQDLKVQLNKIQSILEGN